MTITETTHTGSTLRGDLAGTAAHLLYREARREAAAGITEFWPDLDVDTAYRIQDEALAQRQARGERLVGVKLGLTSRAKQKTMGIDSPGVAWLTDAMVLPAGVPLPRQQLIHPRAEPEIAFVLGERLAGPGVTAAAALASVRAVVAGIEVIDSRYADFKFTMPDVVADNNSSGLFVLGGRLVGVDSLDLIHEACLLEVDGQVVDSATGAAVLGHPGEALAFAANHLGRRGHALEAGWVVLTGGMTDAVPVRAGARVAAHFTSLGTVTISGGTDADN